MKSYRVALEEEISCLSQLSGECGSDRWSEDAFLPEFKKGSVIMCCECDKTVVAFAVVGVSFDEGYLHLVATHPDFRKQGIASRLLAECEEKCRAKGVEKILLDVRVSNITAVSLYQSLGYSTLCTRKNFYSHPTEDGFTMVKEFKN